MDGKAAIDSELAVFVERLKAAWAAYPGLAGMSFAEQRAVAEEVRRPWRQGGPVMAERRDLTVSGATREVPVRLHVPRASNDALPALIYLHGGGFTTFSMDTHDRIMREYAARADMIVIGVDYALSPEAKFPVALHEVFAVLDWIAAQGHTHGIDPARLAIGGDSAGANLSLSACLSLRDRGAALPAAMLLAYGFFDDDETTLSHRLHGGPDEVLTTAELRQFLANYLDGTPAPRDPLALPALAELHGLPPSFHIVAECDPLADSGLAMARRLADAGNEVRCELYHGATHSFLEAMSIAPIAERALAESAAWLAAVSGRPAEA